MIILALFMLTVCLIEDTYTFRAELELSLIDDMGMSEVAAYADVNTLVKHGVI